MRRILLFILPVLIIVTAVVTIFGIFQVRFEQERLTDELRRRAKTVAESMELSVSHVLLSANLKNADVIVKKFEERKTFQGCAIYDQTGRILAITPRISLWEPQLKAGISDTLNNKSPRGQMEKFGEFELYSYTLPVLDEEGRLLGAVEVIYDTSYISARVVELWKGIIATLLTLIVLILAISFFLHQRIFTLPVQRLTKWFHHFQKGETDSRPPIKQSGALAKLASEVEQLALSMRVARKSISEEARLRVRKDELWTQARLRDLVRAKLRENALVVVSNREPYMHVIEGTNAKPRCVRPPSGVVTAIHPILCACGGTWVAHGSGNADQQFVNSKNKLGVPPNDNRYILKRVWLTKEEAGGYYYGFSNEGLWPLCHIAHTRPIFRDADWQIYKEVNQKFANSVLEELPAKHPFIFIQDYHFTLLGRMIKEKRPDATIALFWHIPWPNPEIFSICPYQEEILEGMLACDLIGFHVQYHCNNFLDTANRLLESRVDAEKFSVVRYGKETFVRAFPISVETPINSKVSAEEEREMERIRKEYNLQREMMVAVGVDRIDYTKGLIEKVLAIDRFFEKYPEYKKKIVFIQLAAPSRTHIKRYHDLISEIDELVEKKNWKYAEGNWKPIIYLKRHFSQEEIRPYYLLADYCVVSPIHDGMNLVSKEYVAAKSDLSGCLILSRFAGSARELTDAIQMNPYSIEEFADCLKSAIEMPVEEKKRRMAHLRSIINENNVYRWAANIITELTSLKKI
ncbi:MAG: trehalose-6-phosphate synthase [Candidatus Omnitrophota bacterium]|nr:trehalose-6-phosphate synthase [Candidatus Omnitrophota bacterium]